MSVFPSLDDLARQATERPDEIALASVVRSWTFAELADAVDAVSSRLREAGVKTRDIVAIDLPAAHEWIVDLALFRLAARSASLRGVDHGGSFPCDVLVTAPGPRGLLAPLVVEVDELWIDGAVSRASAPGPLVDYARPDSIFRLMLTSGTTGTPRAAAYSLDGLENRLAGLHRYWTDARPELNFMSLSTTGGVHTAIASLHHGTAYRAVDRIDEATMRWAAGQGIRVLCGSPIQVARALELVTEHGLALPELEEIRMAGASASPALLALIESTVAVPVRGVYGSTEGGGVTMRMLHADDDPANVGPALPGLELQVVDDAGSPVPDGTPGTVRYRGPGLVAGYFERGTVTPFPGGWFAPGDTGVLVDGSLVLGGRSAELINVGGSKIDPTRVDELALTFPGVRDAAAFGFELRPGIDTMALAVVSEPDCDLGALDQVMRQRLSHGYPTTFWRVAEIPRNRMGKVERGALASAFGRAQR